MSRKKRQYARVVLPDPKYGQVLVTRMVNLMMRQGKKGPAERAFYAALDVVQQKTGGDPIEVLNKAMSNVKPIMEVRPRRVGGATYQVPSEVRTERANALAVRWIIGAATSRAERGIREKLAAEILDASNNRGAAVKKREETHKMADANKAFAHFKW